MKTIKYLFVSFLILSVVAGCKKIADSANDIKVSEDNALLFSAGNDISSIADQSIEDNKISSLKTNDIASVLGDSVIIVKDDINNIVTVDFGAGYTALSGRTFKGKIIITHNGKKIKSAGFIGNLKFDNFFINDNEINESSSVKIENVGPSGIYEMVWNNTSTLNIIKADGTKIYMTGNVVRSQKEGIKTLAYSDDVFSITGKAQGTASNGVAFTYEITKELIKNACRYIVSGVITYTSSAGFLDKTLDFGDGSCDGKATFTVLGNKYEINL